MDSKSAANTYQRTSIENAPPLQVVRYLYQGALRFLAQAGQVDAKQDPQQFHEHLARADAIVSELRSALDHDVDPELAENLAALYEFCETQFAMATVELEPESLEPAAQVLRTLYEAWSKIEVAPQAGA